MSNQPFEITTRQLKRTKEIAETALNAPPGEKVGLKSIAPDMITAAQAYLDTDKAVSDAERAVDKEVKESDTEVNKLKKLYDELLPGAQAMAEFAGTAASTYNTVDDFIIAAEDMENAYESYENETWSAEPLTSLRDQLDRTSKEYSEQVEAYRALQKAQTARVKASDAAREKLIPFRQAVRATYGSSSREYRDIKDKSSPTKKDSTKTKTTETSGVTY